MFFLVPNMVNKLCAYIRNCNEVYTILWSMFLKIKEEVMINVFNVYVSRAISVSSYWWPQTSPYLTFLTQNEICMLRFFACGKRN